MTNAVAPLVTESEDGETLLLQGTPLTVGSRVVSDFFGREEKVVRTVTDVKRWPGSPQATMVSTDGGEGGTPLQSVIVQDFIRWPKPAV